MTRPPTLPDYWVQTANMPRTPVELFGPRHTPTRLMTPVERATVRVVLAGDWVPGRSIVHETALRMRIWDDRGLLAHVSGHHIAENLQSTYWAHPSSRAHRGWDMLRAVDAANIGVEVWCSTLTSEIDRYERVRLAALLQTRT